MTLAPQTRALLRRRPNRAAEADAAFGGIMMGLLESRRSLAAIQYVGRHTYSSLSPEPCLAKVSEAEDPLLRRRDACHRSRPPS
jgi:hypothetical protein